MNNTKRLRCKVGGANEVSKPNEHIAKVNAKLYKKQMQSVKSKCSQRARCEPSKSSSEHFVEHPIILLLHLKDSTHVFRLFSRVALVVLLKQHALELSEAAGAAITASDFQEQVSS